MLIIRHGINAVIRGLTILLCCGYGWIAHLGSAWVVHHDATHIRLHDLGLGLVADSTELVFSVGPAPLMIAGLLLGTVLALLIPLRESHDGSSR